MRAGANARPPQSRGLLVLAGVGRFHRDGLGLDDHEFFLSLTATAARGDKGNEAKRENAFNTVRHLFLLSLFELRVPAGMA